MNRSIKKSNTLRENGTTAVKQAKEMLVTAQTGAAVLAAVKSTLKTLPVLPPVVKEIIDIPGYGDLLVGLLLRAGVPAMLDNETVKAAIEDAHTVAVLRASDQFTVIQDVIQGIVQTVANTGVGVVQKISKSQK